MTAEAFCNKESQVVKEDLNGENSGTAGCAVPLF
jgi:hypothetical protein